MRNRNGCATLVQSGLQEVDSQGRFPQHWITDPMLPMEAAYSDMSLPGLGKYLLLPGLTFSCFGAQCVNLSLLL